MVVPQIARQRPTDRPLAQELIRYMKYIINIIFWITLKVDLIFSNTASATATTIIVAWNSPTNQNHPDKFQKENQSIKNCGYQSKNLDKKQWIVVISFLSHF